MDNVKEVLQLPEYIRQIDWSRKTSIFIGTLVNLILVAAISQLLSVIGLHYSAKIYVIAFTAIELIMVSLWIYMRWLRVFDTKTISVGFAIKTDEASRPLFEELRSSFVRQINEQDLTGLVKMRHLPSDLSFQDSKSAQQYASNKGLRILVWGDTSTMTVQSKKVSVFRLKVAYQYSYANQESRSDTLNKLEKGTKRGIWAIEHDNSLAGLTAVGGNILEISLYALAISLISVPQLVYALRGTALLENLEQKLRNRIADQNFPNLDEVKRQINEILFQQYSDLSIHYFIDLKKPKEALEWAQKAIDINPRDYTANIGLARLYWELGNQEQARVYTNKASSIDPSESLHRLNLGFLNLYDGRFGKALEQYKKMQSNVRKNNMVDAVDFLQREYDSTGKPALLFGAGWLSVKYADKTLGKRLLEDFLKEVGDEQSFRPLIRESNKVIKKLK